MGCSLGSVTEIAECIYQAKELLGYAEMAWGILSGTLFSALVFVVQRWRGDREELTASIVDRDKEIEALRTHLKEIGEQDYVVGLISEISTVVRHWSHPKVAREPNIPKEKDTLARRQAPIPGEEDLVALMDFTRLGTMSHFLAITYQGLYWTGGNALSWQDFVNSDIVVGPSAVQIGERTPIDVGGGIKSETLGDMLVGLHDSLKPHFEVQPDCAVETRTASPVTVAA